MKTIAKTAKKIVKKVEPKRNSKSPEKRDAVDAGASLWDQSVQKLANQSLAAAPEREESTGVFTAGEMGEDDQAPDAGNPQGVQGGRGPLQQEGEGNRQNDQLAELAQGMDSEKELDRRR